MLSTTCSFVVELEDVDENLHPPEFEDIALEASVYGMDRAVLYLMKKAGTSSECGLSGEGKAQSNQTTLNTTQRGVYDRYMIDWCVSASACRPLFRLVL